MLKRRNLAPKVFPKTIAAKFPKEKAKNKEPLSAVPAQGKQINTDFFIWFKFYNNIIMLQMYIKYIDLKSFLANLVMDFYFLVLLFVIEFWMIIKLFERI